MTLLLGIILGLLWGFASYVLRQRTKLTVVQVSASLTLVAGLLLPRLGGDGWLFATLCTAVSYATMSSVERCERLWETLLVSGLCSLIVIFGQNVLVGIGGRLGTFAAIAVLIFILLKTQINRSNRCDQCEKGC